MAIMGDDAGPKSAYELAMERLRKQDEDAGVERQVVTAAQKAAIAEIRNFYEAKLAELDVLHQGRLRSTLDHGNRAAVAPHGRGRGAGRDMSRFAPDARREG